MVILVIFIVVWLAVRVIAAVGMVVAVPDQDCLAREQLKDRLRQPAGGSPQDAPYRPQDAVRADLEPARSTSALTTPAAEPPLASTADVWREVGKAFRDLAAGRRTPSMEGGPGIGQALAADPDSEGLTALRETIVDTVSRPNVGPSCLGGREDAYLRAWDDAFGWITQGHDAAAPPGPALPT